MSEKKRMLIVNDLLSGGGVERLLLDLIWVWHDKYDITVFTYYYDANHESILPDNVEYWYTFPRAGYNKEKLLQHLKSAVIKRKRTFQSKKRIEKGHYDILLAMKDGEITRNYADSPIPCKIAWNHTDYSSYYYTFDLFGGQENELDCLKKYKYVVCVAEKVKEGIIQVLGDPGNLIVKNNPLNIGNIVEKSKEPVVDIDSLELPQIKQPVRFVSIGRINYQKGYDLLLEACHMLDCEGYDNYEVIIVGANESWSDEHNRINRTIRRLDVNKVHFIGGRSNPYKYIAIADWFLSSSLFEGYSYVSQEAALLDVPLLLTDCSGVRELLGDSEYGIVMEPSVLGIYNGMKRVLDDKSLREHYKNQIIKRKEIITYQERIDDIEKLFS